MTDRADLIRRLNEAAIKAEEAAEKCDYLGDPEWEAEYRERAALLREAVKALEGGVTNDPDERYCYVNCGLPAEQCACYRRATKAP